MTSLKRQSTISYDLSSISVSDMSTYRLGFRDEEHESSPNDRWDSSQMEGYCVGSKVIIQHTWESQIVITLRADTELPIKINIC